MPYLSSAALGLNARDIPDPGSQPPPREQAENPTPESTLAKQVADIASSASLSHAKRRSRSQTRCARGHRGHGQCEGYRSGAQNCRGPRNGGRRSSTELCRGHSERHDRHSVDFRIEGALPKLKAAITEAATAAEHTWWSCPLHSTRAAPKSGFGGGRGDIVVSHHVDLAAHQFRQHLK